MQMKAGSLGINYEDMTKKAQEMLAAAPAVPVQKREREEDAAAAAAEEPAAKVPATGGRGCHPFLVQSPTIPAFRPGLLTV